MFAGQCLTKPLEGFFGATAFDEGKPDVTPGDTFLKLILHFYCNRKLLAVIGKGLLRFSCKRQDIAKIAEVSVQAPPEGSSLGAG